MSLLPKPFPEAEHRTNGLCNICKVALIWSKTHELNDPVDVLKFQLSHEAFQESALKCLLCAFLIHDIYRDKPSKPQSDDEIWSYWLYFDRRKGISKISVFRDDTVPNIPVPLLSGGLKGSYFLTHSSGKHYQIDIFS